MNKGIIVNIVNSKCINGEIYILSNNDLTQGTTHLTLFGLKEDGTYGCITADQTNSKDSQPFKIGDIATFSNGQISKMSHLHTDDMSWVWSLCDKYFLAQSEIIKATSDKFEKACLKDNLNIFKSYIMIMKYVLQCSNNNQVNSTLNHTKK